MADGLVNMVHDSGRRCQETALEQSCNDEESSREPKLDGIRS
jgi:hypothetical protein